MLAAPRHLTIRTQDANVASQNPMDLDYRALSNAGL
jgi:hypothetical protein